MTWAPMSVLLASVVEGVTRQALVTALVAVGEWRE